MDHPKQQSISGGLQNRSASPRNPLRFGSLCGNISCYELWCCRKMEMTCVEKLEDGGRWSGYVWVIFPSSKSDQNLELMNQRPQVLTSISREQASCIIVSSLTLHPMLKGIWLKPVRAIEPHGLSPAEHGKRYTTAFQVGSLETNPSPRRLKVHKNIAFALKSASSHSALQACCLNMTGVSTETILQAPSGSSLYNLYKLI